jgi:hypothetical protein
MMGKSMLANKTYYVQTINTLAGDMLETEGTKMNQTVCGRPDQKIFILSSFL